MKLKAGVNISSLKPPMVVALMVANDLYKLFNIELVVTSGMDGSHTHGSKHFQGLACDLRVRDFNPQTLPGIIQTLKGNLGSSYFVLLEKDHIHIQYNGGN